LGAGVAVYGAATDPRVAAVILENAVANGERTIRGMHTPETWERFLRLMEDGARRRSEGGDARKVHRFDIFEMPKHLQVNLRSNNSLMEFSADTPAAFFMFRPEDVIARIAPRPVLILHSAGDRVCTSEEAFSLARLAKPPVELHLMDGANHFLFVDADPRVGFILRNWLDRFFPVEATRVRAGE
jgi:pimeloyl-ACP methyl ester carboxylesterase